MAQVNNQGGGEVVGSNRHAVRWWRTIMLGLTAMYFTNIGYAVWRNYARPPGVDFVSFWAAGRLVLAGRAIQAYDIAAHRAVELTAGAVKGLLPFPYPPPFLFVVTPLALQPFWVAFALWVLAGTALYLFALRRLLPMPYALAQPAVHVNAWIGQNGLLTCSIFVLGTSALETRPIAGGIILGLLALKPQLAILIPVSLVAGQQWRALAAWAGTAVGLLLAALLVFGLAEYQAFFRLFPQQARLLGADSWAWNLPASVFAVGRFIGLPQLPAMALQAIAAASAAAVTWRAWARELPTRVPILAAATLLVPPYLFAYDSVLLIVPLAYFVRHRRSASGIGAIWMLCTLPIVGVTSVLSLPNTIPFAAALSLWLLLRERSPRNVEPASDVIAGTLVR